MKLRPILMTTMLLAAVLGSLALVVQPANAQGPAGGGATTMINLTSFQWCSTVDYADVAAKALGIATTDLRFALASGKSLETLATEKNVDIKTVTDALDAAATADIDQAVKDGLLTQDQADTLKKAMTTAATATGNGPRPGRGMRILAAIDPHNPVKPVVVAAGALGMTCPDLAKQLQARKSIADVAASKNVSIQTVTDALTKAYQDAIQKDVDQGLISKAQAEAEKTRLVNRVLMMVSTPGGVFGGGRFGGRPDVGNGGPNGNNGNGGPGRPGRPDNGQQGGQGQQGNPANPPATQPAPAPTS